MRHVASEKSTPHKPKARATTPISLNNNIKPKIALTNESGIARMVTQRFLDIRTVAKRIGAISSGKLMIIETVRAKSSMDLALSFPNKCETLEVRVHSAPCLTEKLSLPDIVIFRPLLI